MAPRRRPISTPVWAVLEKRFELMLVNARHVPGRKPDINDAQWLCQLLEAGSGVVARELRAAQTDPHAREPDSVSQDADLWPPAVGQPAAQILEDTGIKLGGLASGWRALSA